MYINSWQHWAMNASSPLSSHCSPHISNIILHKANSLGSAFGGSAFLCLLSEELASGPPRLHVGRASNGSDVLKLNGKAWIVDVLMMRLPRRKTTTQYRSAGCEEEKGVDHYRSCNTWPLLQPCSVLLIPRPASCAASLHLRAENYCIYRTRNYVCQEFAFAQAGKAAMCCVEGEG